MHVTESTALTSCGGIEVKQEVEEQITSTTTATTSDTVTTNTSNSTTISVSTVNGTSDVSGLLASLAGSGRDVIGQIQCKVEAELDGDSNCSSGSCVDSLGSNGCWGAPMEEESDACMRKRLFTSLTQSFPGSALSRMLHSMDTMPLDSDDEDLASPDKLSSSCFAEIRLDKGEIEDDELTSLAWLQDADLLKNINAGEEGEDSEAEEQKENEEGRKNGEAGPGNFVPQTHPPHVPYNPLKHVNSKPPYSFSCLIFMAVEDSPQKKLPVKDIYNWILTHFPYFQNAPTGWKNSVRHNLSLNKCFKKVEKDKGQSIGKGSLWCIDPDYRPNLLQALRKTPYHPYHQLQMMSTMPQHIHHVHGLPSGFRPLPLTQRPVPNTVSPHLFPFLSRKLAQTQCDFDSEMQDVANTLVAMKGFSSKNSSGLSSDGSDDSGPTSGAMFKRKLGYRNVHRRHTGPIICTLNPSEDHTYSATRVREEDDASGTSSIDNEYDFGSGDDEDDDISEPSECPSDWDCGSDGDEVDGELPPIMPRKRLKIDLKRRQEEDDEDEEMKQEGAKALLNLAGIRTVSNEDYAKSSPRKSPSAASSTPGKKSRATGSSTLPSTSSSKTLSTSSKTSPSTSPVKARTSKTAAASHVSPSSSKASSRSSSSKPSPKLSASWTAPSKTSSKPAASPSLSASTSSLTIMTRRGRAAAEAAAAAAAPGVCTRGKKPGIPPK